MQLLLKPGLEITQAMGADALLGLVHFAGLCAPWEFQFDVKVERVSKRVDTRGLSPGQKGREGLGAVWR